MHPSSPAIVAAARACVGARFRSQGRTIVAGLDCAGVVLLAASAAGVRFAVAPYRLGGDHETSLDTGLAAQGCARIATPAPGDIVVAAPAPGRRHLGIFTPLGLVHAHAGLRRVVEGPLDPAWDIIDIWRLPQAEG